MGRKARQAMKAISIRQPWASMFFLDSELRKTVENRAWRHLPTYRGELLIHAAAGMTRIEYAEARSWIYKKIGIVAPPVEELPFGGIIGLVDFVDVIDARFRPPTQPVSRWFTGPIGLVFENPRKCEFIPMKGQLGIFPTSPRRADLNIF